MTIKPIETEYAGCRFRSRLEARWAVFFDAADIPWEYEPQGYELPSGTRYLPDFLLPECGTFVEVKGDRRHLDLKLLVEAGRFLPELPLRPFHGRSERGARLVLLGPIPRPPLGKWPKDFIWCEFGSSIEGRIALGAGFGMYSKNYRTWYSDRPDVDELDPLVPWPGDLMRDEVQAAYLAARQARFEHGQSPKVLRRRLPPPPPPPSRPTVKARAILQGLEGWS